LNLQGGRNGTAACALASVLMLATGAAVAAPSDKQAVIATPSDKQPADKQPAVATAPAKHAAIATSPLKNVPLPRPRPHLVAAKPGSVTSAKLSADLISTASSQPSAVPGAAAPKAVYQTASLAPSASATLKDDPATSFASAASLSEADLAAVKQVIELARRGRSKDATELEGRIEDPLARKLAEWAILRSDENGATFARFRNFIAANPGWPNLYMFRKRAEAMLWQERGDLATIRAFTGDKPISGKGRFALGRALLAQGDQAGAQVAIRDAWRTEPLSGDAEREILDTFGGLIARADEKARMNTKLYANENETGLRAALRLGGDEPAIAKARIALNTKANNAKALLDALPASTHNDPLVMLSHIQVLRRADKIAEATELMLAAPREEARINDTDEWWIERRLIARKLLDLGDVKTAYQIARDAAPPSKENYRVEHEFTAGWIALRFLNDPALAAQHFARISGTNNPIALARANYWRGRAAEAMGRSQEARSYYDQAARHNTAYYGQLARAKLGLGEIVVAPPPLSSAERRTALTRIEVVRAAEILYAIGERDLVIPIMADLAERHPDAATMAAVAELATYHDDARSVLIVGKAALGRGYAFDHYAFPTFGLPRYSRITPDEVENAVVYAIARQESAFNPKDVSSAHALGLMQVTPEAGRYIAKKFNVGYDQQRLLHDNVYNMQIGAAELYDDISGYNGSYILAFAGYNAGRGRVREWVERYGDPRSPDVDPVDWVERIPFSETRNYVQRIIENIQVYRARFGGGTRLMIEADIHRGASGN
jgi:soluble lytic murein transglycosylase